MSKSVYYFTWCTPPTCLNEQLKRIVYFITWGGNANGYFLEIFSPRCGFGQLQYFPPKRALQRCWIGFDHVMYIRGWSKLNRVSAQLFFQLSQLSSLCSQTRGDIGAFSMRWEWKVCGGELTSRANRKHPRIFDVIYNINTTLMLLIILTRWLDLSSL